MELELDLSKCVKAFSLALDLAEMDFFRVGHNHSQRLAYIALNIGEVLGLSVQEREELFLTAMLHDNALTMAAMQAEDSRFELLREHCVMGEENIGQFPLIEPGRNVIRFHHENYDGSGVFGISGDEIPLLSRIIRLSDFVESRLNAVVFELRKPESVRENVERYKGWLFCPQVAEAFIEASGNDRFWSDLSFHCMDGVLFRAMPEIVHTCLWDDVVRVSAVFAEIIDSKSVFTTSHSRGVTERVDVMCEHYGFNGLRRTKLHIAANLHDIGKLYIPGAILNKPYKLDSADFMEVRKHPYFTRLVLDGIPGFEEISRWAANHHEKLNGGGYPEGLKGDELDFESRLMGVVDVYHALVEDRPYRKGMSHERASKVLDHMVRNGDIDPQIAGDVKRVFA